MLQKALLFCDVSFGWYEGKKGPQMYNNMMMGPSGFWIAQRKQGTQTNNMTMGPSDFWIAQRKQGPQRIYMMWSKLIGRLKRGHRSKTLITKGLPFQNPHRLATLHPQRDQKLAFFTFSSVQSGGPYFDHFTTPIDLPILSTPCPPSLVNFLCWA